MQVLLDHPRIRWCNILLISVVVAGVATFVPLEQANRSCSVHYFYFFWQFIECHCEWSSFPDEVLIDWLNKWWCNGIFLFGTSKLAIFVHSWDENVMTLSTLPNKICFSLLPFTRTTSSLIFFFFAHSFIFIETTKLHCQCIFPSCVSGVCAGIEHRYQNIRSAPTDF